MSKTATKSKPKLWKRIVARIKSQASHGTRLDNGQEEKPKLQLRLIRKQVVVIEVVVSQKLL